MPTSSELAEHFKTKSSDELKSILLKPGEWSELALRVAKAELEKRSGIAPVSVSCTQSASVAGSKDNRKESSTNKRGTILLGWGIIIALLGVIYLRNAWSHDDQPGSAGFGLLLVVAGGTMIALAQAGRKSLAARKVCAGCGRTEQRVLSDFVEARKKGVVVIGDGNDSGILCCDNCNKCFCGRCQVDLGYHSGCPVCGKALD